MKKTLFLGFPIMATRYNEEWCHEEIVAEEQKRLMIYQEEKQEKERKEFNENLQEQLKKVCYLHLH